MIKTKYYMSILLIALPLRVLSQNVVPYAEIGQFRSANSMSINPAGFIFIIDEANNEIIKLDTLGNEVNRIGGFGWDSYSFDSPADIFTNTLNIYIADKNNDRIQIYDKDLNYLSSFSTEGNENIEFRYPTGVAVYSQGDLFILDSDNARILKFDLRGDFITTIGGIESGNYVLNNPKKFTLMPNGNLIVIDNRNLVFFDQFGNYINKVSLEYEPTNISSTYGIVAITSGENIYYGRIIDSQLSSSLKLFSPEIIDDPRDAVIFNSKLYVLTEKQIYVYQITD
ncbi:MAG: NHL repeat-containing protein [Bacteroidota bacterium]